MKLCKKGSFIYILVYFTFISFSKCFESSGGTSDNDPFRSLGIPDLNPNQLLEELDTSNKKNVPDEIPKLKSIEDLPNFLKNTKMNQEEAINVLTRFLIQDDITLKKYGVVYDQTGFDGIQIKEKISPIGTEERLTQRARSAANIWFREKYTKLDYDSYSAEEINDEIVPNWRIYKVLMIGKSGDNTFIKVCLPLEESETALCSDQDELCSQRAEYVEQEKKKNEDYIEKIKTGNFFKNKGKFLTVKLLPGEKMIVKDKDKNVILTSHNMNQINNSFLNPPHINAINTGQNPLINAMKTNSITKGHYSNAINNNINENINNNLNGNTINNINNNINANMNNNMIRNTIGNNFAQFGLPSNQSQKNLFLNSKLNQNNPQNPNGYHFKQMDETNPTDIYTNTNQESRSNLRGRLDNSKNSQGNPIPGANPQQGDLYKDIVDLKTQLNHMIQTLKQKESFIMQNNQMIGMQPNISPEMNNMNMNRINQLNQNVNMGMNMPVNPAMNGMNLENINNMNNLYNPNFGMNTMNYNTLNNINQMGLNAYMQYTGTDPFQQKRMMFNNQIIQNQFNTQKPAHSRRISNVL